MDIVRLFDDEQVACWAMSASYPLRTVAVVLHRANSGMQTPPPEAQQYLQDAYFPDDGDDLVSDLESDIDGTDDRPLKKRVPKPNSLAKFKTAIEKLARQRRRLRKREKELREWAKRRTLQPAGLQPPAAGDAISGWAASNHEELLCFPDEPCYRPRMTSRQHREEKKVFVSDCQRDLTTYTTHRAANPLPASWPAAPASDVSDVGTDVEDNND
jgi:hypothetical protein